jgi:hypothetical protein
MTVGDKRLPENADELVRDIRRATRRKFSSEEKIWWDAVTAAA